MATFVLVHGSSGGGWVWRDAVARLRGAGHDAWAPTLTGMGERVHLAMLSRGYTGAFPDTGSVVVARSSWATAAVLPASAAVVCAAAWAGG